MDGGAWWAAVHGVARSWTRLSDFTFTFHFYALEKEMATHSSILAWGIPGTGEPGGLPSMGSHRVGHDWSDLAAAAAAAAAALYYWRLPTWYSGKESACNAGKWKVKVKSLSRVQLLETPWTAAFQAPLSMGFSRQEYWSGVPLWTGISSIYGDISITSDMQMTPP